MRQCRPLLLRVATVLLFVPRCLSFSLTSLTPVVTTGAKKRKAASGAEAATSMTVQLALPLQFPKPKKGAGKR